MLEVNYTIETIDGLPEAAARLLNFAGIETVFLFNGDMGAGKTTLIKSICLALGVAGTVTSPTYSLVNQYEGNVSSIYHFDFYRINSEDEAYDIGFEEYLDSGAYCFIEWPEKIKNLWPSRYVKVSLSTIKNGSRMMNAVLSSNN